MENKPTPPKGRYQLKYRGTKCLNCEHPLDMSDRYCPHCSQANSTKKLSMKDFFDEFFSNIISYDSKLLKTLSALLLRPGKITKDYVAGKRVSYTNPFRFLLSLAIIYFLILNFSGDFSDLDRYGMGKGYNPISTTDGFSIDVPADEKELKEVSQILDSMEVVQRLDAGLRKRDSLIKADPKAYFQGLQDSTFFERIGQKQDFFRTAMQRDSLYSFSDAQEKYGIAATRENRACFSIADSLLRISQEPGSFISFLVSNLPFATFFFLPVFAFFIWLMYIRKKYTYTDNLIFSFHIQSLFFILLIVSFLVDSIFNVASALVFMLAFGIYLYKAMRKFYEQGRFKTILKYMFLNTIFFILAGIAAVVLVLGSAFTY